MATPTFSVIIPTHNRGDLLREAIQSVLNQTWQDFEIIVVDDASPEAIEPVVRAFDDARIRFERNSANRGPGYSRNRGGELAQGEFISFLDSDDFFLPTFLAESLAEFRNSGLNTGFIWTGYQIFEAGVVKKNFIWAPARTCDRYLLFLRDLRVGAGCGITIRNEVFKKIKFDPQLRAGEDTEFFLRLVQQYQFGYISKALISIRRHPGERVTHNSPEVLFTYVKILSRNRSAILGEGQLRIKYAGKLMALAYQAGRKHLARKFFKWALPDLFLSPKLLIKFLSFEIFGKS